MRVALGQIDMVWEDKEASYAKAEKMIQDASGQNADIIIFPEMSFTGFSMDVEKIAEDEKNSQTIRKMQTLAIQYNIAIGFGWAALCGDTTKKAANRFTIVDAQGEKVTEYTKIHPFSYGGEDQHYEKGKEIVTVPFMGRTISLFVCYDLRFPELFEIAAKKADIMFVIANWPAVRSAHWTTLLRARAIETQSYVVGVNCVGERDHEKYSGDSMAVDAIGNILGEISNREGILLCDLDDRAWSLREKFATANDRQEDLYTKYFDV